MWIYFSFSVLLYLSMYLFFFFFTSPIFSCSSDGKESTCNAGDLGFIHGLGISPGEEKGYPLQNYGLENSMDCLVHGIAESDMTEQLSLSPYSLLYCSFVLQSELMEADFSSSILLSQKYFGYLGSFMCPHTFLKNCVLVLWKMALVI